MLAAAFSVLVTVASLLSIFWLSEETKSLTRTHELSSALEHVLSLATDAETASRGYAMTGESSYLEPYLEAKLAIWQEIAHLATLTDGNRVQRQQLAALSPLVERRLQLVNQLIDLRMRTGFEAARAFVATGEGKRVQDAIRVQVGRMAAIERANYQRLSKETDRSVLVAQVMVVLGSLLTVVIVLIARRLVVRDYAGSRRAHAAVSEANAELDERVNARTAELLEALHRLQLTDAAFRNTQESIMITDRNGVIVAVNPAFVRVTEYAEEEALGQHIRLRRSGEQDRSFYQQMWQSLLEAGSWQGEVCNRRRSGELYHEWLRISAIRDAQGETTHYIGVATDLSRMNRVQTALERLAHHDALTGLPNRLLLMSRLAHSLERAHRDGKLCAVMFQDLDRFKQVNDALGHAAGDELLQQVAGRMGKRLRDVDTLARLGGDEFVVVLEGIDDVDAAAGVAQSLIDALNVPFTLEGGNEARIGASIGISFYPGDGTTAEALLERADKALYAAKREGRNMWRMASPAAGAIVQAARTTME